MAIRSSRGPRLMAVVAVIENGDGSRMMLGSKDILEMSLELGSRGVFGIEVRGFNLTESYAEPYTGPLQLTQSGLYLPSMAFRALPAPPEKDDPR